MFRFLTITAVISFVSAQCSDKLFFEKNQINQYTRYSRSRGHTISSVPALDWVMDLEKNAFGKHLYDEIIRKDDILMLFAYKSSLGLHVYKVCRSVPEKVTGPLLQNSENAMGYHFQMNDEHRLKKHLVNYDFTLFGEDESALRREIVADRQQIRRENQLLREKRWNDTSLARKFIHYFWVFLIVAFICGIGR